MSIDELSNIPFEPSVLHSVYPNLSSIPSKAIELEKAGKIIRLKKGLYVLSPKAGGQLLSEGLIANHLYGPSYVSLESALRHYGLIPERVRAIRSMTIKHSRSFENEIGRFEYRHCRDDYFHIGIRQVRTENTAFLIASPEKALCDLLTTIPTPDIRFRHQLHTFLEENLRFDMDGLHSMDKGILLKCVEKCKKKQLIKDLIKLI